MFLTPALRDKEEQLSSLFAAGVEAALRALPAAGGERAASDSAHMGQKNSAY